MREPLAHTLVTNDHDPRGCFFFFVLEQRILSLRHWQRFDYRTCLFDAVLLETVLRDQTAATDDIVTSYWFSPSLSIITSSNRVANVLYKSVMS